MTANRTFGAFRDIQGKAGTFPATLVPKDLIGAAVYKPIPITVSGTASATFTVNASVSNPVFIWDGHDYISLKETISHTMVNSATNVAISTAGILQNGTATPGSAGVKYYYLGLDSTGALTLAYSDSIPSFVEGPFASTYLGHPGTTRDRAWRYVGFSSMNASTAAFDNFTKIGYTYHFSNHAYPGVATAVGIISMAVIPDHSGVRVGGYVTGQATGNTVSLAPALDSAAAVLVGKLTMFVAGASAAAMPTHQSFNYLATKSGGDLYAEIDATATNVNIHITEVHDVV